MGRDSQPMNKTAAAETSVLSFSAVYAAYSLSEPPTLTTLQAGRLFIGTEVEVECLDREGQFIILFPTHHMSKNGTGGI